LAQDVSEEASENFAISDTLRKQLEISETKILHLCKFLADALSHVRIESVPENFRPIPKSCPALRSLSHGLMAEIKQQQKRITEIQSEISSGERISEIHADFVDIMDTAHRKLQQLADVAEAAIQQPVHQTGWNSNFK
jgi:biotin operon repressor